MQNKIREFRNQIESAEIQHQELLNNIQSLEVQLLKKRNDLSLLLEDSQTKKMAKERYYLRFNISYEVINLFFGNSEFKRCVLQNAELEKKLEIAEHQVEELKLSQEHIITRGIEVIEHLQNT